MVCEVCAKFFITRRSYEIHCMTLHSDIDPKVQCDECGKWLKHPHRLGSHKSLQHGKASDAPLQCTQCDKMFKHKQGLKTHIEDIHSDPKFECSVCHKMFKRKITLTVSTLSIFIYFIYIFIFKI